MNLHCLFMKKNLNFVCFCFSCFSVTDFNVLFVSSSVVVAVSDTLIFSSLGVWSLFKWIPMFF